MGIGAVDPDVGGGRIIDLCDGDGSDRGGDMADGDMGRGSIIGVVRDNQKIDGGDAVQSGLIGGNIVDPCVGNGL